MFKYDVRAKRRSADPRAAIFARSHLAGVLSLRFYRYFHTVFFLALFPPPVTRASFYVHPHSGMRIVLPQLVSRLARASKSGGDRKSAPTPTRNSYAERCSTENWSVPWCTARLYPGVVGIKKLMRCRWNCDFTRDDRVYFWQGMRAWFAISSRYMLISYVLFPPIFWQSMKNFEECSLLCIFIIALPYFVIVVLNFFKPRVKKSFLDFITWIEFILCNKYTTVKWIEFSTVLEGIVLCYML